jgi:hypothetical protein
MGILDRVLGPGDRDAFAAEVLRLIRRASPSKRVTYDSADFSIRIGKDDGIVNLHNVWANVAHASRFARAAAARRFVAAMSGFDRPKIPDRWEDAAPLLLPRLRPRIWHELIALQTRARGGESFPIAHEPLGEHYAVELVCDFPESCTSVLQKQLDAWGKTFAEAMMTATRNLRGRPPEFRTEFRDERKTGTHVLLAMTADSYDATRILVVDSILKESGTRFDPVVLPIRRDVLAIADPDDADALAILAAVGARETDGAYPVAGAPLRRSFGAWTPWLPPVDHAARPSLATLVERSWSRDYAEQGAALEAVNQKEGRDVYVGSRLHLKKDGTFLGTATTWADGILTWLPRTDRVAMGRRRADGKHDFIVEAPWERLVEIAGASMKPLDMWPPRWEVRDFPDEATMNRLIAVSTNL